MTGSLLGSVAATAFALVLVLGLAFAAIRLLRVWQDRSLAARPQDGGGALRFLRAMPIGPRERVVLMEAEDERFLIGVAAGTVTLLARWPRRERAVVGAEEPAISAPAGQRQPAAAPRQVQPGPMPGGQAQ